MSEEPFVYIKDREVVYINAMKATKMTTEWRSNLGLIKEPDDVPLFLHPPKPEPSRKPWQSLTDEEFEDCVMTAEGLSHNPMFWVDLKKLIEEKLKDKNT